MPKKKTTILIGVEYVNNPEEELLGEITSTFELFPTIKKAKKFIEKTKKDNTFLYSFIADVPNDVFYYDDGETQAEQSADDVDIFVCKSPYFTYAQFCSPCAPGAGYLLNPLTEPDPGNKAYCFGHDWFESGKAPYPVYSVETGELVRPD